MKPDSSQTSYTPRTDAAERLFHEAGRPPMGFVDSRLARLLEYELSQALDQLRQLGAPLPAPPDERTLAMLASAVRPKRAILSKIDGGLAPPSSPAASLPQVKLLQAALAGEAVGHPRSYEDGEVLFRRGEQAEHLFIVLAGAVSVSQRQDKGPDCTLGVGTVFGEHALFEEGLHRLSAHAQGQVRTVLVNGAQLRTRLAADTTLLPHLLMALSLQRFMVSELAWQHAAGALPAAYALLSGRSLTGPELQRALLDDKNQLPGDRMDPEQAMGLKLQATDHLPTRMFRAGESLGALGQEHSGLGVLVISGKVLARWGDHRVELGPGAVIGLAEGLSGQPFVWDYTVDQDVNARVLPIERALQQLERADAVLRALASHDCAAILMGQQGCAHS